jgi:hypothetical protein
MRPRVLLAHSLRWPNVARLSIACRKAGFVVEAIAPKAHPIHKMSSPERTFVYRPGDARASLRLAIEASRPQLIIPCDDRIVAHLHALHDEVAGIDEPADSSSISTLIEASLGSPKSYEFLRQRSRLGELSGLPDVRVPQTDPVANLSELREWVDEHGLPALLKLDGTWGGRDIVVLRDRAAIVPAFLKMRLHRSGLRPVKRALSNRDIEPLLAYFFERAPSVSVQSLVTGRLANCAIACWRGEVLASVAVEVARTQEIRGVATVVRPVEGQSMIAACRAVARHLQLSGVCGFDFVIDDVSKESMLIEINPRATQINHLHWGSGVDLPTALRYALDGQACASAADLAPQPAEVALFPQEWLRDPASPYLAGAFHDVPYEEPELIKFYGYEPPSGAAAEFAAAGRADSLSAMTSDAVLPPDCAIASAAMGDAPTTCDAVQLREGDVAAPLFLFPGVDCDAEEMRDLAGRLRGDRAVFGLGIDVRSEEAASRSTVEQMATQATAKIRTIQPVGPYHLAGYSFGGMVAFAAAQQFRRSGAEVKLLALIGAPISQRYWPMRILLRSLAMRTARHLRAMAQLPLGTAGPLLAERASRLIRLATQRIVPSASVWPPPARRVGVRPGVRGHAAMERY